MFSSLFGKNKAPTTINPLLGAELVKLDRFPSMQPDSTLPDLPMRCRRVTMQGTWPDVEFKDRNPQDFASTAFIVDGSSAGAPLAIVNRVSATLEQPDKVEIWELDAGERKFLKQRPIGMDEQDPRWLDFVVADLACLPGDRLAVLFSYRQFAAAKKLFLYDVGNGRFSFITRPTLIPKNLAWGAYMEVRPVDAKSAILFFATDRRRKAAEVYHNYYNHFWLFGPRYPDGIELLKLGIDVGNATEWQVRDQTLYLHTMDTRDLKNTRESAWSLSLNKAFQQ